MFKTAAYAVLVAALVMGCNGTGSPGENVVVVRPEPDLPQAAPDVPYIASATAPDGLELRLELGNKKTSYVHGDKIDVLITAINRSKRPIPISSLSGSPQIMTLWWYVDVGWEMIRSYPSTSLVVRNDWVLPTGGVRRFRMQVEVDRGWPSYSPLALVARLNGRRSPQPYIPIEVYRPGEEKKEKPKYKVPPTFQDLNKALTAQ